MGVSLSLCYNYCNFDAIMRYTSDAFCVFVFQEDIDLKGFVVVDFKELSTDPSE